MHFLNFVASRMYHEGKVTPDNPRNVQIYMKSIMKELQLPANSSDKNFQLRMQGHIELQNHIQLFGDLDK